MKTDPLDPVTGRVRGRGAKNMKVNTPQPQAQASFVRPQIQDNITPLLKKVVSAGNDYLDKKASAEGLEQGQADMAASENFENAKTNLTKAESKFNTIRGSAYKEGARLAFIVKAENQMTEGLNIIERENLDSQSFTKAAEKYKQKFIKNLPSNMMTGITQTFDKAIMEKRIALENAEYQKEVDENTKVLLDQVVSNTNNFVTAYKNGEDVEKMVTDNMVIINSLYNNQKQITLDTVSKFIDTDFNNLAQAMIESKFENLTTVEEKKAFVESLLKDGGADIIKDIHKIYGDELKAVFPKFKYPNYIDESLIKSLTTGFTANINGDIKKYKYEIGQYKKKTQVILEQAMEDDISVDDALPDSVIFQTMNKYFADEDDIQSILDNKALFALTQEYTSGWKDMNVGALGVTIKQHREDIKKYTNSTNSEDQTKLVALNTAIDFLERKEQELKTLLQRDANFYETLEFESFDNQNPEHDAEWLAERQKNAAIHMGVPVNQVPLMNQKEMGSIVAGLQSKDINEMRSTIEAIKTLEIDKKVRLYNSIFTVDGIAKHSRLYELAMTTEDDQQNLIMQMIITMDEYKESVPDQANWEKEIGAKSLDALNGKLMADSDFMAEHADKSIIERNKVLEFYKAVILHQFGANPKDMTYADAKAQADQLWASGWKKLTIANGSVDISHGQIDGNTITEESLNATIETANSSLEEPIDNLSLNISNSNNTLSEIEDAVKDGTVWQQQGDELILTQNNSDADLGFAGTGVTQINPANENGEQTATDVKIDLTNNTNESDTQSTTTNKHSGPAWNKDYVIKDFKDNDLVIKNSEDVDAEIDEQVIEVGKELDILRASLSEVETQIKQIKKETIQGGADRSDELATLEDLAEQRKEEIADLETVYGPITGKIDRNELTENFYKNIHLENKYFVPGVKNVTAHTGMKTLQVMNGIFLKNIQKGATWTEWELDYLSKFGDYQLLANTEIRKEFIKQWNIVRENGGYATKGTGAKVSPAVSTYLILKNIKKEIFPKMTEDQINDMNYWEEYKQMGFWEQLLETRTLPRM
jgi:hypothetical protein